ncbi:kinase-like protein [Rhizophagus irregularis]|nr:kinase-like protein [Rhizophagus irregularis]
METFQPNNIVEWIPYNNLQNVKYLTKGGCSEIYKAKWIGGGYYEWDFKEKQLTRYGNQNVILKELENVESANRRWFEESKSHLTISNKWSVVVQCFGLTKNPSSGNYMLVMNKMEMDLRTYLKQSYNNLIWKERIQIAYYIINGIDSIHNENAIHRDLHSGNILYNGKIDQSFYISDLGFCGPVDKLLNSVYGNLPYIAPEVITGKKTTFASDIYSIGILMWEISSGQPPFVNYEHNYDLAMKIVNGMRPKIVPGTPLEYKKLMEQCWDADSTKRPDADTLLGKIKKLLLNFQSNQDESQKQIISNQHQQLSNYYSSNSIDSISKNYTSKTYQFEKFPEPKNATEEEQEAFHSKPYSFNIPNNIDDFNNSSVEKNVNISKSNSVYKVFGKLEINSNYNIQNNDYEKETVQQTKKHHLDINDDDANDNPNSHSEKQDDLKISNGKISKKIKTS